MAVGKHKAGFCVTGHAGQQLFLLQVIPRFREKKPNERVFGHAVLSMAMLFGDVLFLSRPHSWSSVVAGLSPRLQQASEASDDAEAVCTCSP